MCTINMALLTDERDEVWNWMPLFPSHNGRECESNAADRLTINSCRVAKGRHFCLIARLCTFDDLTKRLTVGSKEHGRVHQQGAGG